MPFFLTISRAAELFGFRAVAVQILERPARAVNDPEVGYRGSKAGRCARGRISDKSFPNKWLASFQQGSLGAAMRVRNPDLAHPASVPAGLKAPPAAKKGRNN
jgi:hypothetical protein